MSCENNVCGTGGWAGPLPGDPDNNITLSARVVFGGVLVSWSYPSINGHAVAHTEVFRGTSANGETAVLLDRAGGSSYLDRVNPPNPTEYFYWIEVISINGTRAARIGPVSTIAEPIPKQTLESLTGRIDESLLAETLRTHISGITLNNQAIYQEIQDRLAGNTALQNALAQVQSETGQAMTFIQQEINSRADADGAIVEQVLALAAGMGDTSAAIIEERRVRATADEALAEDILIMSGRVGEAEGAIIEERRVRVEALETVVEDYEALTGRVGNAEGAIVNIQTLTIDPESALATSLTTLRADVDNAASAVEDLDTALATGTHALASSVKTVEAALNGNVATGQVGLIAEIDSVTGTLNSMWTAKVQVNNLIGGFGISNNGQEVLAGFDVDTFFVGRTGPDVVKPFIISGGKVYMDEAIIREASIGSLYLKGEAVTVPVVASMKWATGTMKGKGEFTRVKVNSATINLDQPGLVYILMTGGQGYDNNGNNIPWGFEIGIANSEYSNVTRSVYGRQAESAPVLSSTWECPAGPTRVDIYWLAHPTVHLGYSEIFVMGVKK